MNETPPTSIAITPGTWFDVRTAEPAEHPVVMRRLAQQQVVLLGETHDRFDVHRWQLHVALGLMAHRADIALGFEMFPRRLQPVLDAFVAGTFSTTADFLEAAEWREVWRYDPALYLPLFHLCRQFRLPMLALNCHRPLVTRVGKEGWDAIPMEDRDGLTPARPALPAYRDYLSGFAGPSGRERAPATTDRFVRAQQTWDRAFACNITRALDGPAPPLVIGIIGRGHLEYGYGTPYQLADLGIDRVSIALPTDEAFDPLRDANIADALFRLPATQGKSD